MLLTTFYLLCINMEIRHLEPASSHRTVREPRIIVQIVQTTSEGVDVLDDGYKWRKYRKKVAEGNSNPR